MLKNRLAALTAIVTLCITAIFSSNKAYALNNISIEKIIGKTTIERCINISKTGFTKADTVILVADKEFQMQAMAAVLSKINNAPILLSGKTQLDPMVLSEISRLKATKAIILGNEGIIGNDIDKTLKGMGITAARIHGDNAYDIGKKLSQVSGIKNGVLVVSNSDFMSLISAAPIGGTRQMPIIVSPLTKINTQMSEIVKTSKIPASYLIGDTSLLSANVEKAFPNAKRLSAADAYASNVKMLTQFGKNLNFSTVYLTTGNDIAASLCMSSIAIKGNSPIILIDNNTISKDTINFLKTKNISNVIILDSSDTSAGDLEKKVTLALAPLQIKTSSIVLSKTQVTLNVGASELLKATVKPVNAANKGLTYVSADNNIATVDNTGKIKAINPGNTIVSVAALDGRSIANCSVMVIKPVTNVNSVTINKSSTTLEVGTKYSLSVSVKPDNAANKAVKFSSSDNSILEVDDLGTISALKEGKAIVTVTPAEGKASASCTVTVVKPSIKISSIIINKAPTLLETGKTDYVNVSVKPDNATNKTVNFSSSNNAILTVDNYGKVSALKEGKAVVTVKTQDTKITTSCAITVFKPIVKVNSVTISKNSTTLCTGSVDIIKAYVNPSNATNPNVTFNSSNNAVATVDKAGKITAVTEGTATITVVTADGLKSASCVVTVVKPAISNGPLTLNKNSIQLGVGDSDILSTSRNSNVVSNDLLTYESSDNNIVSIDGNGNIIAMTTGQAIITVTSHETNDSVTCVVNVTDGLPLVLPAEMEKSSTVFAIDIGHNVAHDSGARGIRVEDDCTMEVGTLVIQKLRDLGYKVVDCLPKTAKSQTDALKQRTDAANAAHANYYLAIHFNKANGKANGSEIYYGSNKAKGKAQQILSNLESIGYSNRGIKDNSRGLYVLSHSSMPAILVECSFLDSKKDMDMYDPEELAQALVDGLIETVK